MANEQDRPWGLWPGVAGRIEKMDKDYSTRSRSQTLDLCMQIRQSAKKHCLKELRGHMCFMITWRAGIVARLIRYSVRLSLPMNPRERPWQSLSKLASLPLRRGEECSLRLARGVLMHLDQPKRKGR